MSPPIRLAFGSVLYRLAFLAARAAVIGAADDSQETALFGKDGSRPPVQGIGGGGLGPAPLRTPQGRPDAGPRTPRGPHAG
jgi:hypothetical protein